MKKILSVLNKIIMDFIIIMAIYCIFKFTLFNGEDLPPIVLGIILFVGLILGDILRKLIKAKQRSK